MGLGERGDNVNVVPTRGLTRGSRRACVPFQRNALPRGLLVFTPCFSLAYARFVPDTGPVKTALFWHPVEAGKAQCDLCPHGCRIAEGQVGLCRVRGRRDGELKSLGYGRISSAALDPIEKKPLYHFHPGSQIFSIGGWGCNFACSFCQNWTLSQVYEEGGREWTPQDVVDAAQREESFGVAYTYNEPLVGYEFVEDCAQRARETGLANILVTNGFIQPEPAARLLPLIDALNVDLKSMDDRFYREQCHGRLAPVLAFIEQAFQAGCHVELTNLIIPGLNDAEAGIEALAAWVQATLSADVPLHLSAYRPMYKMTVAATPVDTLERAHAICRRRLNHVYVGNVFSAKGCDTTCPDCGAVWVRRRGYHAVVDRVQNGLCASCRRPVNGCLDARP